MLKVTEDINNTPFLLGKIKFYLYLYTIKNILNFMTGQVDFSQAIKILKDVIEENADEKELEWLNRQEDKLQNIWNCGPSISPSVQPRDL